jgi:hypothetical protein
MADLERSQEASRREMELIDQLSDLRQRNARVETSKIADDPTALLAALHAERESKEEEARRAADDAEDDALVAKYFSKIAPPKPVGAKDAASVPKPAAAAAVAAAAANGAGEGSDNSDSDSEGGALPAALTIKRRAPLAAGEPTVEALLAAKGREVTATAAAPPPAPAQVKRKRNDMQKILGIKKKK